VKSPPSSNVASDQHSQTLRLGRAFRLKSHLNGHIWVVAYNADDTVIIFNFSSWAGWKDQACRVKETEYRELQHESVIIYRGEIYSTAAEIDYLVKYEIDHFVSSVSSKVLTKIIDGAKASARISGKLQKFFLP
jgi:hypothetical protein